MSSGTADSPLILSVDDHEHVRVILRTLLTGKGYRVRTAEDGLDALGILEEIKPDLILIDILMPRMGGLELCARLKKDPRLSQIPVIFLTGESGQNDVAEAMRLGAVAFLQKPVALKELEEVIGQHVAPPGGRKSPGSWRDRVNSGEFARFMTVMADRNPSGSARQVILEDLRTPQLYEYAPKLGLTAQQLAKELSLFLDLPYLASIDPRSIRPGLLPSKFSRDHHIIAIGTPEGPPAIVASNPFRSEILHTVHNLLETPEIPELYLTEPENIESVT